MPMGSRAHLQGRLVALPAISTFMPSGLPGSLPRGFFSPWPGMRMIPREMRLFQDVGGLDRVRTLFDRTSSERGHAAVLGHGRPPFSPVDPAMGRTWSGQPSDGSLPENSAPALCPTISLGSLISLPY